MSLTRKSILLWADLCLRVIANKSTESAIRTKARKISRQVTLPPGEGRDSVFMHLTERAKHLPDNDLIARQRLIDTAHAVATALIASDAQCTLADHSLIPALKRPRRVVTPILTHVITPPPYSRRVDIFDRPDPQEGQP